jgi:cellulose synthase operon protein B
MHHAWFAWSLVAIISVIGVAMRPVHSAEMQRAAERPASRAGASTASGPSAQSSAALLRRLPPLSKGSRLSGEEASMVAPVYVTRRQVDARARFRLGTLSSVSVVPESGTLTVSVNGADVKAVPVGAAYGLRITEFDIPAGLLRTGWNAVGIAAHHRHRVDCSVGRNR